MTLSPRSFALAILWSGAALAAPPAAAPRPSAPPVNLTAALAAAAPAPISTAPAAPAEVPGAIQLRQTTALQAQLAMLEEQQRVQDAQQHLTLSQIDFQKKLKDLRKPPASAAATADRRTHQEKAQAYVTSVMLLGHPTATVVWGDGSSFVVDQGGVLPDGSRVVAISPRGVQTRKGANRALLPFRGLIAVAPRLQSSPSAAPAAAAAASPLPWAGAMVMPPAIPNPPPPPAAAPAHSESVGGSR